MKSSEEELLFHNHLQSCQNDIFKFIYFPIKVEDKPMIKNNEIHTVIEKIVTKPDISDKVKKEFSNLILAFFQHSKIEQNFYNDFNTEEDKYIKIKLEELIQDSHFKKLLEDHCISNSIPKFNENYEYYLIDCIKLLERNYLGSYSEKDGEKIVEIKSYFNNVVNDILNLFKMENEELTINSIFNSIKTKYDFFYNYEYIKFILKYMADKFILYHDSTRNSYTKAYHEELEN